MKIKIISIGLAPKICLYFSVIAYEESPMKFLANQIVPTTTIHGLFFHGFPPPPNQIMKECGS